jgi:hypothetical protein
VQSVISSNSSSRDQEGAVSLAETALPFEQIYYPLGYPLRLETNWRELLGAAEECWGSFPQMFDATPLRISLAVTSGGGPVRLTPSRYFGREHLLSMVASPDNFLLFDFESGFACGSVTRATAMDYPLLRYRFLIPGAHMLTEQRAMTPLHGALVERGGRGVLLTGDSFAGKSTLAYACARAGWTYVSDDATFVIRGRSDRRAFGNPRLVRLREGARELFPELSSRLTVVRPNGKIAIEVPTRELSIRTAHACDIDHVVFLDRGESRAVNLRPFDPDRALEIFRKHIVFGSTAVRQGQLESLRQLLGAGIWRLEYSGLAGAIQRLEQLAETGA